MEAQQCSNTLQKKAFNMFALSVSHTAVFPPNFSDGILIRFLFSV